MRRSNVAVSRSLSLTRGTEGSNPSPSSSESGANRDAGGGVCAQPGTTCLEPIFSNADLARSLMRFANLKGAILSGAILSGADLSGADLTGADATEADLSAAILINARGLDTMKGLEAAQLSLRR
jgi:uncharacterized protein YjbI with pentapeptide repeats